MSSQSAQVDLPQDVIVSIINGFASQLQPSMAYILVPSVLGAMLFPLLIAVSYFSTARSRRKPYFGMVIICAVLGIVQTFVTVSAAIRGTYHPFEPIPISLVIASEITILLPTFAVDVLLLLRMLAVYPLSRAKPFRVLIFIPPVLMKIVRVVSMIGYAITITQNAAVRDTGASATLSEGQRAWVLSVSAVVAADNIYATAAFLLRLHSSSHVRSLIGSKAGSSSSIGGWQNSSVGHRIRILFWISLTNFVFPIPIFVAQLILFIRSPTSLVSAMFLQAQSYIAIISVVFTTVWSHSAREQLSVVERASERNQTPREVSLLKFRTHGSSTATHALHSDKWEHDVDMELGSVAPPTDTVQSSK